MVTFRPAAVSEDTARTLLLEYFGSRELSFPDSQGRYRTVFPAEEQFTPPLGVFLIARADADELGAGDDALERADVGCGGIRRLASPRDDGVRFEVKHLWLQQRVRGHGLGRALLLDLERRARSLGATELVLDTNDSLTAAGGLYRSTGFRRIDAYNENPNATAWFAKDLD